MNLKVWIDFVCPYCMLANKPLHEAIAGLDVQLDWMPFELRPEGEPPFRPEDEFIQNGWKHSVYPLAARLGVEMRLPAISPQPYTRLAFEGLQFAKQAGKTQDYGDAVLNAFFQRGRDIGNVDVLTAVAEETGLAGDRFKAALLSGEFRNAHAAALRSGREIGIRAVPSVLIGNRVASGIPDPGMLRQVIERELAAIRAR